MRSCPFASPARHGTHGRSPPHLESAHARLPPHPHPPIPVAALPVCVCARPLSSQPATSPLRRRLFLLPRLPPSSSPCPVPHRTTNLPTRPHAHAPTLPHTAAFARCGGRLCRKPGARARSRGGKCFGKQNSRNKYGPTLTKSKSWGVRSACGARARACGYGWVRVWPRPLAAPTTDSRGALPHQMRGPTGSSIWEGVR